MEIKKKEENNLKMGGRVLKGGFCVLSTSTCGWK